MQKYDIWVGYVAYTSGPLIGESHPALVYTIGDHSFVMIPITSNVKNHNEYPDYEIKNWKESGLRKPSSIIFNSVIYVDGDSDVIEKHIIGHLDQKDVDAIEKSHRFIHLLNKIKSGKASTYNVKMYETVPHFDNMKDVIEWLRQRKNRFYSEKSLFNKKEYITVKEGDREVYQIRIKRDFLGKGKFIFADLKFDKDTKEIIPELSKYYGRNPVKYADSIRDMALSRSDAMDRCISLGEKFIQHFDKIYKNEDARSINHWINEMQGWLDSVLKIKLKNTNRPILNGSLRDWFFTAGANPEDFIDDMDENEKEAYDEFATEVINTKDIKQSFENIKRGHDMKKDELKTYEITIDSD